jgi:feruloyl esterase
MSEPEKASTECLLQIVRSSRRATLKTSCPVLSNYIAFAIFLSLSFGGEAIAVTSDQCSRLIGSSSGTAKAVSAEAVSASETIGGRQIPIPFCRIHGIATPSADSLINFEVWLPFADHWTGRLKVDGTGGFAGAIPVWSMANDVAGGFAAAGSDMGHTGGESADWTIGHPEKVKDWGYRAHYVVTIAAKALAREFYGRPVAHTYFEGCSNGGRQGMMMAERYPELFDGIVAGAPSMFYADMVLSVLWTGYNLTPIAGQAPIIPPEKLAMIRSRTLAACDALDGLIDQQITNPLACKFDPSELKCTGEETPDCLTADQLRIIRAVYHGIPSPDGAPRWNGPVVGSEAEWEGRGDIPDRGGFSSFVAHVVY